MTRPAARSAPVRTTRRIETIQARAPVRGWYARLLDWAFRGDPVQEQLLRRLRR